MMSLTVKIVAVVFMLTFMFIGVWGFILLIKILQQLQYKNYLMEKLIHNVYMLSSKTSQNTSQDQNSL